MEDASKARLSFSKQLSVNMLMVMEFMPRLAPGRHTNYYSLISGGLSEAGLCDKPVS